ncbi:integral membrane protein [Sporormia fimetaria CBS 119925]|uniref:Integral membrane protein n=1 Tax=Sporormia fimetaria CBS 119925 TaxID=1340428 RepID=A0A6A6VN34_9PLEO|nr:integral membrane protein [Sporormia fimetaria CBS 119925]
MSFIQRVGSSAPEGYPVGANKSYHLYDPTDIWRFTLLWTLLLFGVVHLVVALWACAIQWRNWKLIWITPIVFVVIGGLEALIAGSIVGGLLGGIYQSGYFKMSTWIPLVWAIINVLVLILSSFAIQGAL